MLKRYQLNDESSVMVNTNEEENSLLLAVIRTLQKRRRLKMYKMLFLTALVHMNYNQYQTLSLCRADPEKKLTVDNLKF